MSEEIKRLLKLLFETDYDKRKKELEKYHTGPDIVDNFYNFLHELDDISHDFAIPAWRAMTIPQQQYYLERFEPIEEIITTKYPEHTQIRQLADMVSDYLHDGE